MDLKLLIYCFVIAGCMAIAIALVAVYLRRSPTYEQMYARNKREFIWPLAQEFADKYGLNAEDVYDNVTDNLPQSAKLLKLAIDGDDLMRSGFRATANCLSQSDLYTARLGRTQKGSASELHLACCAWCRYQGGLPS